MKNKQIDHINNIMSKRKLYHLLFKCKKNQKRTGI